MTHQHPCAECGLTGDTQPTGLCVRCTLKALRGEPVTSAIARVFQRNRETVRRRAMPAAGETMELPGLEAAK